MPVSRLKFAVVALVLLAACATTRKESTGTGDERVDESGGAAKPDEKTAAGTQETCGPQGKGNVTLYDARTAEVVSCALVQIAREDASCVQRCRMLQGDAASASSAGGTECPDGTTCASERIFNGRSNKSGQLTVTTLGTTPLTAVAEGYAPTMFDPTPDQPGGPVEVELLPTDGFILKLLDGEGNYLNGVSATFKQGGDVLAQLRTNDLANVYFTSRNPFAGDPVTVEVDGFAPAQVSSPQELGADGHTLTLKKK